MIKTQIQKYPPTRFMGSKQSILPNILEATQRFDFQDVIDLFSGSGVVSYMFKAMGKQVYSNDFMKMNSIFSTALIENNSITLTDPEVEELLHYPYQTDGFIAKTFNGLYFSDEENHLLDRVRFGIKAIGDKYKQSIAMMALIRAAIKKRPRGIFAYTGDRYNDGRRDLKISLEDHFREAVKAINEAVFNNGKNNLSLCDDAMKLSLKAQVIYMDPPYFSPYSDNDYVRRYHFVEGLACDWNGLDIQNHTKTKKFKSYPSPFSSRKGAIDAFDKLLKRFRSSIIIISYSSNSLPTQEEMLSLLYRYKRRVEVISIDYRYSFANHRQRKTDNNKVKEFLFLGY